MSLAAHTQSAAPSMTPLRSLFARKQLVGAGRVTWLLACASARASTGSAQIASPATQCSPPTASGNVAANNLTSTVLCTALSAVLFSASPSLAAVSPSPWSQTNDISFGVKSGRIQSCPSNINPNCVSTSSTTDSYSPAWRATGVDLKSAVMDLNAEMMGAQQGAVKLQDESTPYGWYLAYSVNGKFSKPDVVEFLVKPEVPERAWEGDKAGALILYRSMAGDVKYIWPLTQPVSDLDTQKKRMKQIRQHLGWSLVGCELIECYDEMDDQNSFGKQFRFFSQAPTEQ